MSILINNQTRLLIQGITGRQASMNAAYMQEYGTQIVAGVTPGKGGQVVNDKIPVFDSIKEAKEKHPEINTTCIYVPPQAVKKAAFEALNNKIPLILMTTERCPQQDLLAILEYARTTDSILVGPNSIGILTPGEAVIGLIGARVEMANRVFRPGRIGVISRSGGQTSTIAYYITRAGYGQSTAIGIGGDAIVGTSAKKAFSLFQEDADTDAIVYFGEMGTHMEEELAEYYATLKQKKPLLVYVAGQFVLPDLRYGHAGALISRGMGDVASKLKLLSKAGAIVLDSLDDLGQKLKEVLEGEAQRIS